MQRRSGWLFVIWLAAGLGRALDAQAAPDLKALGQLKSWSEPTAPIHIAGPIYYVGTRGLGAYLIRTPDGHILIDGATPRSAWDIEAAIRRLGFKSKEIKLLLLTHAHVDHAGTVSFFKKISGARVAVMDRDVAHVESGGDTDPAFGETEALHFPAAKVDRVLRDGETIEFGGVRLTARLGAGHTQGATTWITTVEDGGQSYRVVFPCCTTINASYRLGMDPTYPGIADDYRQTLTMLESLEPDIWLAAHTETFDFERKKLRAAKQGARAWVDPVGYRKWVAAERKAFEIRLAKDNTIALRPGLATPPSSRRSRGADTTTPSPIVPSRSGVSDLFYAPPRDRPSRPGMLLRSEPLEDRELPRGARAWRILYTTTLTGYTRAVASAVVLAPSDPPFGPRPVVSWAHGTVGIASSCAPSLTRAPAAGVPAVEEALMRGWVIVATDYTGLGTRGPHPYMIGEAAARSALDAVRAAKQMPEISLQARTVIWGHSQGGHAALWQGIIAPRYAPDVNVLGVVADAPPTDLAAVLLSHSASATSALIAAYVANAYSDFYPDVQVDRVVRRRARTFAQQSTNLCSTPEDVATAARLVDRMGSGSVLLDPTGGALGRRLEQNGPDREIDAPLLIIQGESDTTVPVAIQDRYIEERCSAGQRLEYWKFAGLGHSRTNSSSRRSEQGSDLRGLSGASTLETRLVRWTEDRFTGRRQRPGCQRRSFESE